MSCTSWANIQQTLFHFLQQNMNPQRGILLGLSGGADSICLYHALLEYRKWYGIFFVIAHIDHGWRQESSYEAGVIRDMAMQDQVPFYCKKLLFSEASSEEAARNERLRFFLHICNDLDLQAVLLAHHADDQGETVLKRLFEGASFTSLRAMKFVTRITPIPGESLVIWRPFLSLSKKEIIDAAHREGFAYFRDTSNEDPKFLRARLRQSLLPHLSSLFGKEISVPLSSIAKEALEIEDYLDQQILPYMTFYRNKGLGGLLDLSEAFPQINAIRNKDDLTNETKVGKSRSSILLKHLIRRVCHLEKICLSRTILEHICQSLVQNKANQAFKVKEQKIYLDRRRIFFPKQEITLPQQGIFLRPGIRKFGPWSIFIEIQDIHSAPISHTISNKDGRESGSDLLTIDREHYPTDKARNIVRKSGPTDRSDLSRECEKSGLREANQISKTGVVAVWTGHYQVVLPEGDYTLRRAEPNDILASGKKLTAFWSEHRVPAFLRNQVPVVATQGVVFQEFLTGKPKVYDRSAYTLKITCL